MITETYQVHNKILPGKLVIPVTPDLLDSIEQRLHKDQKEGYIDSFYMEGNMVMITHGDDVPYFSEGFQRATGIRKER